MPLADCNIHISMNWKAFIQSTEGHITFEHQELISLLSLFKIEV